MFKRIALIGEKNMPVDNVIYMSGEAEAKLLDSYNTGIWISFCAYLKSLYDVIPLYEPFVSFQIGPEGEPSLTPIDSKLSDQRIPPDYQPPKETLKKTERWLLNDAAIEILNRALKHGCKWAEEELSKIQGKKPQETLLDDNVVRPAP